MQIGVTSLLRNGIFCGEIWLKRALCRQQVAQISPAPFCLFCTILLVLPTPHRRDDGRGGGDEAAAGGNGTDRPRQHTPRQAEKAKRSAGGDGRRVGDEDQVATKTGHAAAVADDDLRDGRNNTPRQQGWSRRNGQHQDPSAATQIGRFDSATMSGIGSRNALEETLQAILKLLDGIDEKMRPLQPLQKKVAALETVHAHDQQQKEQQAAMGRLEVAQRTNAAGWLPPAETPHAGCHQ
ncbi:hypothetical protein GUJ93_ZPchr0009g991 [Zizania palustris]|uniref:Uncharacterized protein n=1 Tax=Zizania palustris TaxID=103762 RepID=A0A8J5R7Y5_ZIZPA|nr:hypothetical protein GUJ93_ZPchr0009g991 [Zizania palustris]